MNALYALVSIWMSCAVFACAVYVLAAYTPSGYLRGLHARLILTLRRMFRQAPVMRYIIPAYNMFLVLLFMKFNWFGPAFAAAGCALMIEFLTWRAEKMYFDVR